MKGGSILKPNINEIVKPKTVTSPEVQQTKDLLSLGGNPSILGSYQVASQLYPSDIDMYEIVSGTTKNLVKRFQEIVKNITNNKDTYLMDAKLGTDESLRIIDETSYIDNGKTYRYDYKRSLSKLNTIQKHLNDGQFQLAKKLLKPNPTQSELDKINKELRFHLVRWTGGDINLGYKKTTVGRLTLTKAFKSPSLFKVDIIRMINGLYTDITIIYDIRNKSNKRQNVHTVSVDGTIEDDIRKFKLQGKFWKVLKRRFALAKYRYKYVKGLRIKVASKKEMLKLHEVLNSDLGRLSQVKSMVEIISSLIDVHKNVPVEKVQNTISIIVQKLSNISTIKHANIAKDLLSLLKFDNTRDMGKRFEQLKDKLDNALNSESKPYA